VGCAAASEAEVLEVECLPARLAGDAAALSRRSNPDKHSDRLRPAADTVGLLRNGFDVLGITRLARITHLDCIGIPVWSVIRPNALSLAVSQGKGISDAAAQASAVMEAVELAVAERSDLDVTVAALGSLTAAGEQMLPLKRLVQRGSTPISDQEPIAWVKGLDLLTHAIVKVPYDAVRMDFTIGDHDRRSAFLQSSDGLASGNLLLEAVVHGICERIERDACTLWSFRAASDISRSCIDPASFADPVLDELCRRIELSGLRLRLFVATSDIGVPVFFAAIAPEGLEGTVARHFDISSGSGCHPSPARAAVRAVTEAAQSRLTFISGARDDFHPRLYAAKVKHDLVPLMSAIPRDYSGGEWDGGASSCLDCLLDRLKACRSGPVVVVALGGEDLGVAVARVFIPALEDPIASPHWRPGPRGFRAMLGVR
jgi:YcaO-like protein with predicted kinase domain